MKINKIFLEKSLENEKRVVYLHPQTKKDIKINSKELILNKSRAGDFELEDWILTKRLLVSKKFIDIDEKQIKK